MLELYTSNEIQDLISEKIEDTRIKKNLTQRELVKKAGVSYSVYRNFIDNNSISLINFISLLHPLDLLSELQDLTKIKKAQTIKEMKDKTPKKIRVKHSLKKGDE